MTYWRSLGLSYLRFSSIAAKQVRKAVKSDVRPDQIRESFTVKLIQKVEQK